MTDNELLEAWRGGDAQAGEQLVERHLESVHRFFSNKVRAATDDLVQQTFLACVEAREGYDGRASFRAYLFGIARHILYRYFRGAARDFDPLTASAASRLADDRTPADDVAQVEEQRVLLKGLRALPLELQTLVELAYWEQLSDRELSEALEIPVGTIKSRLRKARKALETELPKITSSRALIESSIHSLESWARHVGGGDDTSERRGRR